MLGTDLVELFGKIHDVVGVDIDGLDITDPSQCRERLREIRPAVTICSAALTAVDYCETHEDEANRVNGEGPGNLAAAASEVGSFLVHYSTDYVYDGLKAIPYVEEDDPNPLSAYGRSKLLGDRNVQQHGERHLILRTSWVFGPNGKNFIRTIVGAARQGQPLRVVADQRGCPTYTRDLARHTALLLDSGRCGIYHLTNDGSCSWFNLARFALDAAGMDQVPVTPVSTAEFPRPARRPVNSILDGARLRREGIPPMRPWQEAVQHYVAGLDA
jgi:dTDP-4-dehydrorhamnose reductase